ncbi:dnaJ homolog subfamily C member 16-like [Tachypleus tridentatus]|uniref:dnaJ homolog subfamily C member 16-like n=1 Tax=Tachypleus tridentatus TaxID=6853 RepID=UPI003FD46805
MWLGLGTIHVQKEPALTKKIGVNSLPYLLRVIDGRPIHYKDNQISLRRIIEFTHKLFPYKTIVDANDDTLEEFLNEWPDNKVNALIFSQVEPSRLRYLLLAFQYNTYASFGLVKPDNSKTHKTCRRYRINKKMESLLIFNEITTSPLSHTQHGRTGSPNNEGCAECQQVSSSSSIVFTSWKNLVYVYFSRKDTEFVNALSSGEGAPSGPDLHVLMLWRQEFDKVRYQWLDSVWSVEPNSFEDMV